MKWDKKEGAQGSCSSLFLYYWSFCGSVYSTLSRALSKHSISSLMSKFQQTPGKYNLVVLPKAPKEAPPITETGGFTVKLPEITGGPHSGSPGNTVTVTGKFFGAK